LRFQIAWRKNMPNPRDEHAAGDIPVEMTPAKAILEAVEGRPGVYTYAVRALLLLDKYKTLLVRIEALESAIRIVRDEIGDRTHGAMYGECCRWWSVLDTALAAEEKKP
jgi:hypothetical protein